ncbi:hypothetical protein [Lysinibacillus sp. Bpr_S20]|uniref:hypothetical protein n=1 Tax=Lysinibacillus sp. Bpr_S20 TaxID=2933964 RepID=UPI002011A3BB|nr:hypothetical protein [Lysinibacillus sp. Bpr_S20]MCL1700818.1 hypothetical protein [Lysinibacillus sp. Bpr_S20]
MNVQEFKNYLVEYLIGEDTEDKTIAVSNINEDGSVYFFIKYQEIADVAMIIYGAYGNHSVLINMNDFDEDEEAEKMINYMNVHGDSSRFKIINGID